MDFGHLRLRLRSLPRSNVAGWQPHRFLPIGIYIYTQFFCSILFIGIADFFVVLVLRFPTNARPFTFGIRLGACGDGSLFVPSQRRTFALRRACPTCTQVSNSSIPSGQAFLPFTRLPRPFERRFVRRPSLFLSYHARARRHARLTSSNPTSSGNSSSLSSAWPSCTTSLVSSSCTTFASAASAPEYLFLRVDTILTTSKCTDEALERAKAATHEKRGWRRNAARCQETLRIFGRFDRWEGRNGSRTKTCKPKQAWT